jgi:glycosyltransferase involved in cell wall biosynthesis
VSVVIPVRNSAETLGQQLDALMLQDWNGPLEVVVADNGSSDGTRELARSYSDRLTLRVVDASEKKGAAHARNVGVAESLGDTILFLDGDDVAAPGYVSAMVAALEGCPVVAARLDIRRLNDARRVQGDGPQNEGINPGMMAWLPFAFGGSLGVRRSVFDTVGLFDNTIPRNEDVDFSYRLQIRGISIGFAPDAVVHVRLRPSVRSTFKQSRESGRGIACLYSIYRSAGMPRRGTKAVARFWMGGIRQCLRARTRDDLQSGAGLIGLRLGLLEGSIRYRVLYL